MTPAELHHVFRHLQFSRSVNRHGCVSIQRFYIYAERGLARQRVAVWIYEGHLHVEYRQTLLARYTCRLDRGTRTLQKVSEPRLYRTLFASPQLELLELDDEQWLKVLHRPPYAPRRSRHAWARQLVLINLELALWLLFPVLR